MALLPYFPILSEIRSSVWELLNRGVPAMGRRLDYLIKQQETIMAALDDLRAAVAAEKTVTQSVLLLLQDLHKRLDDAVASGDPEALQQVVDDLKANTAALSAAVAANTASAGEPTPAPPAPDA